MIISAKIRISIDYTGFITQNVQPAQKEYQSIGKQKEKGQTLKIEDLSALAPPSVELLNLWNDILKVVEFIQQNEGWLRPLLNKASKKPRG